MGDRRRDGFFALEMSDKDQLRCDLSQCEEMEKKLWFIRPEMRFSLQSNFKVATPLTCAEIRGCRPTSLAFTAYVEVRVSPYLPIKAEKVVRNAAQRCGCCTDYASRISG